MCRRSESNAIVDVEFSRCVKDLVALGLRYEALESNGRFALAVRHSCQHNIDTTAVVVNSKPMPHQAEVLCTVHLVRLRTNSPPQWRVPDAEHWLPEIESFLDSARHRERRG